jgi:RNA-binding protein 26
MYGIPDGDIPGVGKVEMTWVSTPLPPVNLAALNAKKEDEEMHSMDVDVSPQRGGGNSAITAQRMENLDYEVADDEDYIG